MSATNTPAKPTVRASRSRDLLNQPGTDDHGTRVEPPHANNESLPNRKARGANLPADHGTSEAQTAIVGGVLSSDQTAGDIQGAVVAAELLFHAAFLDDLENVRKATANRLGAMEREGVGGEQYASQLEALEKIEHQAILALQRAMRKHPLGPWVKRQVGIGEKQAARLIAAIGDVYWNHAENRPRRGPAELWAYCGYRPDQKRRKGVQSNWNADAKMRAFLIAESCVKQMHSPYRAVYDRARLKHAEAVHAAECVRCGPSGKPALPGSPLGAAHQHARALREVAKAVLKDMFLEARRVSAPDQVDAEIQYCCVGGTSYNHNAAPDDQESSGA